MNVFFFQDKLYELDKSWENNLVFYGINSIRDEEERPSLLDNKIREILRLEKFYWDNFLIEASLQDKSWVDTRCSNFEN